jgi:hypothetical protein
MAGGLDDRVTFIARGMPAICDHSGQAAGPMVYPNMKTCLALVDRLLAVSREVCK